VTLLRTKDHECKDCNLEGMNATGLGHYCRAMGGRLATPVGGRLTSCPLPVGRKVTSKSK
jgi:hypothetical protein